MSSDDWEALFALAEGQSPSIPTELKSPPHQASKSRKSKKRKHEPRRTHGDSNANNRPSYLLDRCQSTRDTLLLERLSHSFLQQAASQSTTSQTASKSTTSQNGGPPLTPCCAAWKGRASTCEQCGGPSGVHILTAPSDNVWWNVYTSLRNLRCWCRMQLSSATEAHRSVVTSTLWWTHISQSLPRLRHEPEAESIVTQGYELLHSYGPTVRRLFDATRAKSKAPLSYARWECLVRCIMACDDVYYQLYYASLIRVAKGLEPDGIPHPVTYFGEWSTGESSTRDNALTTLHRLRRAETKVIFADWMTRFPESLSSYPWTNATASTHEARHATVAPPLVSAWRDSCRDFVCHLYSYATIPHATLRRIVDHVVQHSCTHLLEVGAGTGYLAHLLATTVSSGVSVTASDAVTDATNEYHAATPAFRAIQAGDATRATFWTTPSRNACSSTALLLCYPPPQSSMALQTLQHFVQHGGRVLVHVGEFCGLTGNTKFERYLTTHFTSVWRAPCPSWGTDAAHVTVWRQRQSDDVPLLLPCVQCHVRPATRRCRWLRSLEYCSRACHDAHALVRHDELLDAMVDVSQLPEPLDYDSDQHYVTLQ